MKRTALAMKAEQYVVTGIAAAYMKLTLGN
jgi:hypothetical protein